MPHIRKRRRCPRSRQAVVLTRERDGSKIPGTSRDRHYYAEMITSRTFGCLFLCTLGACASRASEGKSGSPDLPPRLSSGAQEPAGIAGLFSPCGFALVGNSDDLHFRMELAGRRVGVRHGSSGAVYVVDGLMVQVTIVPADSISPAARDLSGIELLRMHAAWESAHLSETVGREVRPEEIEILAADNTPSALVWWFPGRSDGGAAPTTDTYAAASGEAAQTSAEPAAGEPNRPTGLVFATAAYGHRVLVMSVQGLRGEPKSALLARAKGWIATVATSSRAISVQQTRADIKAAVAAGQGCAGRPNAVMEQVPGLPESTDADHGLRLDGLAEADQAQVRAFAEASGGVARRQTPTGMQYTNHVCRFQLLLPPGWQEYTAQDFNGHGCSLNLTTAEIADPRESKPISNAVAVIAAHVGPDLDRETLHQRMLFTLKSGNAHITRVTPWLLESTVEDHFQTQKDGQSFEGDLITMQRGDFLYQIFFTATPGTYTAGRANLIQFLNGARWGTGPEAR